MEKATKRRSKVDIGNFVLATTSHRAWWTKHKAAIVRIYDAAIASCGIGIAAYGQVTQVIQEKMFMEHIRTHIDVILKTDVAFSQLAKVSGLHPFGRASSCTLAVIMSCTKIIVLCAVPSESPFVVRFRCSRMEPISSSWGPPPQHS